MVSVVAISLLALLPQGLKVTEVSLGKVSANMQERSLVIAPDGRHIAYVDKRGENECVVHDGVASKLYDRIPRMPMTEAGIPPQIVFSPDGARVAYVAITGKKFYVVDAGKEGKGYPSIEPGSMVFSADSKRLAYPARTEAGDVIVIDGKESKTFDDVFGDSIQFSNDGKRHMFRAMRDKKVLVVLDGTEIPEERFHGDADFSEHGHATDVAHVDGSWIVYIDGMPSKKYRSVGNSFEYSADKKRILYQASDAAGDFLVVDGVETKRYPHIAEGSYGFTPDGKGYVFVVRIAGSNYVVLNDVPGKSYAWVSEPEFSADGSSMAYVAEENKKRFVVRDGEKVGAEYDDISLWPSFSPIGKTLVFAGKKEGREFLHIGDNALAFDQVGGFMFAEDGKTLSYSVREGTQWYDYFGDQRLLSTVDTGLVRSTPDGLHWADFIKRNEREVLYIDGEEHSSYDGFRFVGYAPKSGKLFWVAKRDGLWRIYTEDGTSLGYTSVLGYGGQARFGEQGQLSMIAIRDGEYFFVTAR